MQIRTVRSANIFLQGKRCNDDCSHCRETNDENNDYRTCSLRRVLVHSDRNPLSYLFLICQLWPHETVCPNSVHLNSTMAWEIRGQGEPLALCLRESLLTVKSPVDEEFEEAGPFVVRSITA